MNNTIYFLFLFCFAMSSCLDEIELDVPRGESEAVVVEGKLVVGDPSSISVSVQRIFAFDGTSSILKINGVDLISESGGTTRLDKDSEGEFSQVFDENNPLELDNSERYKLRVQLFDGRVVESDFQEIQSTNAEDALELSIQPREFFNEDSGDFVTRDKLILDLQSQISNIQSDPKRYRWTVERTYRLGDSPDAYFLRDPEDRQQFLAPKVCYVTDNVALTGSILFDGNDSDQDNFLFEDEIFDGPLNDYRYSDTMYIEVVQEGLSKGAFTYFDQIAKVLGRTGSMFEPPAGQITSNFTNINDADDDIFGYFYVTQQKRTRVLVTPDMVGNPAPLCPAPTGEGWRPGQCPFIDCCDCLELPTSSLNQPEFWGR